MARITLPKLPPLVTEKLKKTGYTRGASKLEIYQNRVTRNSTVLIWWDYWEQCKSPDDGTSSYQNGFIVLVRPDWYFETADADSLLAAEGLFLGVNALLMFQHRNDWARYAPRSGRLPNGLPFVPATSRLAPLGGTYMARIHATTANAGNRVDEGFVTTAARGAGIRVYEYASSKTIATTRLQLEALIWLCHDVVPVMLEAGMTAAGAMTRCKWAFDECRSQGLLDLPRLRKLRLLNEGDELVCPLCLLPLSAREFSERMEQAEGRATYDLTTTEISLFHVEELRVGKLQHKPYNLGWGHHFCNVVVKDSGIQPTLGWMRMVLRNQEDASAKYGEVPVSVE